ncbi:RNA polymerase sigma-70 factor (ECF subfamily) [Motilibacter peucedani]|uniref:RNA polymerase sigma-70 factor (ECF subfamily) n=1 Tax=Motilibacter peucedani TaxID=598650 RepID=A0A420XU67_9ACTN|nr:RNA polymerase sigma factor SigM [Motilibacter peucedani]RKS80374.1 RNA polymerase sigma-70 factor (ECF subfamily) [Motilibacter peucedani]
MSPLVDYAALDDAALLARHRATGDGEAFGQLVERHGDRLWAVALRTIGDREEAADAVQDALLSAFRASAAGSFRGDSAVTTWLHRIVVNACLDRVRRRTVRAADALPESESGEERVADPVDAIGRREDTVDLAAALATLPTEQRLALVLVDVEGLSVREAADVLEVAEGTVKSRCARGRARLAPLLAPGRRGGTSGADAASDPRTVGSGGAG